MENNTKTPAFDSPKNWKQDYDKENGNYSCKCRDCNEYFYGHKRRVVCKECAKALLVEISNETYEYFSE